MSNLVNVTFAQFAAEAESRGYKPVQYSQTGYYLKSFNGIRCEFQTTKGGVNAIGYGSSPAVLDALRAVPVDKFPLRHIANLKCSINFAYESLDKFFEFVSFVETISLPAPKPRGRVAAPKPAVEAKPKTEKKQTKTVGRSKNADGSDMTVEQAIVKATAKSTGKTEEEIRKANLQRIKEVAEKMKAEKAEDEVPALEDEVENDVPAFILADEIGGRQPGAE